MAYKKITEADLLGIGLIGIPDTPGLSTEEMQEKFEETARKVIIPTFNRFVDDVTERDSNTYTKDETDRAISDKVQEIGGADMQKAVYDSDNDGVVNSADNGTFLYVHTAGSLTGTGRYGAFKATVTETLANVNVNGSAFNVRCGDESEIELTAGNWYSFILDGDTVNFKQGGGLSKNKLALATATENTVASGFSFYSGDKELKTGTMKSNYDADGKYWVVKDGILGDQIYKGDWSQGDGYVQVAFPSGSMTYKALGNLIDLTDFTSMTIEVLSVSADGTSRTRTFYLADSGRNNVANGAVTGASVEKTVSIDISNLTGFHYIQPRGQYSNTKIKNIYLEKVGNE